MILGLGRALSRLLLACTIELDNGFEERWLAAPRRPWLASWVMWANFLRYLPEHADAVGPLVSLVNVGGLRRWGYLTSDAGTFELTPVGVRSRAVWAEVADVVEGRWRERLGSSAFGELRAALVVFGEPGLPRYLPAVPFSTGMRTAAPPPAPPVVEPPDLPMLLAQPLLRWTLDVEEGSELSLPVVADVLRVLDGDGFRVGELPKASGVSKEGLAAATGYLERRGLAEIVADPARSRGRLVRLTEDGLRARDRYEPGLAEVAERWRRRYGADAVGRLDAALGSVPSYALVAAITPPPGCWRAKPPYLAGTRRLLAGTLPHHPMVLHRGGFPDGS